jgi:hypothetical protein
VPWELFAVERLHPKPLPEWIPEAYRLHQRLADLEGYVALHTNRYPVPVEWIGRRVTRPERLAFPMACATSSKRGTAALRRKGRSRACRFPAGHRSCATAGFTGVRTEIATPAGRNGRIRLYRTLLERQLRQICACRSGVSGRTLGGGIGHLTRKYGLTIDNLLSVDMVLADGSFVVANPEENHDLFWAIRGGGGNFGIVTSFLFEGQPVDTVCAGPMLGNLENAGDVMKWYREFITQAPEEMNGFVAMMTVPPGPPFPEPLRLRKMCAIVWCYLGSKEQADTILEPIRSHRPPAFEFVVPMPFPMLQTMFDPIYPTGLQWYWKADFFKELRNRPTERIIDWARGYYDALHPFGAGGAYMNFMMEEGEDRIRATYRGNYNRLAAVKAKYDPGNFFRVNQNIRPAASRDASAVA